MGLINSIFDRVEETSGAFSSASTETLEHVDAAKGANGDDDNVVDRTRDEVWEDDIEDSNPDPDDAGKHRESFLYSFC